MTEQKIHEAFNKYITDMFMKHGDDSDMRNAIKRIRDTEYEMFKEGYLALLNELEPSYLVRNNDMLYRLPEGVTKP